MPDPEAVRIDKWLWAARFAKTRAAASEAAARGPLSITSLAEESRPPAAALGGDDPH